LDGNVFGQSPVDASTVEAIDLQPAHQLHDVFVVVVNECLRPDDQASLDQLHQLISDADNRVPLAELQERQRPTTVLWWHRAPAANAHRVALPWSERQAAFEAHVVLPAIGEVVFVQEPLADAEFKIDQVDLLGIITEADAARVANAVLTPVNNEAVQVLVGPAESRL
jgi:hypothetical protein